MLLIQIENYPEIANYYFSVSAIRMYENIVLSTADTTFHNKLDITAKNQIVSI